MTKRISVTKFRIRVQEGFTTVVRAFGHSKGLKGQ